YGAGIYAEEFTRRTYDRLLATTRQLLAAGRSVVVDASFGRRQERDRFRQAAAEAGVRCLIAWTDCPRQTALERLDRRQAAGRDPSDGRRQLFDRQAARFEAPTEEADVMPVDTSRDVDYNVQDLLGEIIERGGEDR
ncbi:MAG: ATP-binding protein, partial [Desulfuromonadales bacterium]|nr:ATP-binding protein [Desulfuromonadales bacterium]